MSRGTGRESAAELERSRRVQEAFDPLLRLLDRVGGGFTPEQVLMFAANEIGQIDLELTNMMSTMNDQSRKAQNLRAAINALTAWADRTRDDNARVRIDDRSAITVRYSDGRGIEQEGSVIDALQAAGVDTSTFEREIQRGNMEGIRTRLQNHAENLRQGSEQRSMKLQTLISQRGQIAQLSSQLLAAMHETSKGIIQNTGR
jgi:DNA repair exonuclease SbcCD ATPase subunit